MKRRELKPKHSFDTSVILSYLIKDKDGNECTRYLARIGYLYRGYISFPMIGELVGIALTKYKKGSSDIINDFTLLMKNAGFEYSVPHDTAYKLYNDIRKLDISPMDAILLATAIEHNHDVFVTLDTRMLKASTKIEAKYKIMVKRPGELI